MAEPAKLGCTGDVDALRQAIAAGLAASVVGASAYSFSPLTVIFAAVMFWLFRAAVRGISGTERKWALGSLGVALTLRSLALIGLYVTTNPWREQFQTLFGDGHYSVQRSLWILNDWQGVTIGPLYRIGVSTAYGGFAYDRSLALVQWFLGPSPYGLTLISVAAFFGGTVLLYRLVRPSFGPAASLVGLIVLVFWPTFFVWSISMLKEPVQFLLSATAISAAISVARLNRWGTRAVLMGVVAAAALLTVPLRAGDALIVLGGVLLGYAVFASARRSAIFVTLLLCVVVGSAAAGSRPAVQARVQAGVGEALRYHVGHVATPGKSYRAADQRFYFDRYGVTFGSLSFDEGARFLLRSAAMFVLAPLPSQIVSTSELLFLPQQVAWYFLLALACAGAWIGFRRDALLTGMCTGYCLVAAAVIAPNSGNIGTLIRHRDMIVPFAVWLGGLGAVGALAALSRAGNASH